MARYSDKTDLSTQAISEFAASLKRIAAMLDGNVDLMQREGIDTVSASHFQTSQTAMEKLKKFCGAIQEAIAEYRPAQQPIPPTKKKSAVQKDPKKP